MVWLSILRKPQCAAGPLTSPFKEDYPLGSQMDAWALHPIGAQARKADVRRTGQGQSEARDEIGKEFSS